MLLGWGMGFEPPMFNSLTLRKVDSSILSLTTRLSQR